MYIYKNHLGGLYSSDRKYTYNELYCEECGDCDFYLGQANSREELIELIRDEDGIYGWYDPKYIEEFCKEEFGKDNEHSSN